MKSITRATQIAKNYRRQQPHWRFLTRRNMKSITRATQIAKNYRRQQPHSHLKPPPRGTPASIFVYLIFPETRVICLHFCRCMYGSIFIQICALGSKRHIFSAPECVLAAQGHSGSSTVDHFGTNRKRVYDFGQTVRRSDGRSDRIYCG